MTRTVGLTSRVCPKPRFRKEQRGRALIWLLILWIPVSPMGCSRAFWRKQADEDSYDAIVENLNDERWAIPRIDLTPDPRSRFFDPYDPDCEPLPPDDPAAHVYMHWVDGWLGYQSWHEFGDLVSVENPQWLDNFQLRSQFDPETGEYRAPVPEIQQLTLGQAVELSLINSRDYQFELERLFLSALAVTFERFQFGVRYLGFGGVPGLDSVSRWRPDGGTPDTSTLNSRFGISQMLPTGGQWIVELTNNTLWLFAGENSTQTATSLSFALVQPLLFGAGRKVVLEALTQRERELLYAVRGLARFRREFFTDIVSSYLGLLQQLQVIRNSEANIVRLREQVEALQEVASQRPRAIREPLATLPEGITFPELLRDNIEYDAENGQLIWYGPMTPQQADTLQALSNDPAFLVVVGELVQRLTLETVTLDVLDLQSSLATSVNRLRDQERALQDRLDAFKIQLGLPTDFLISLDDSLLAQFEIIDPTLSGLEDEIKEFIAVWGALDDDEPDRENVAFVVDQFDQLLRQAVDSSLDLLDGDIGRMDANLEKRLASLPTDEERAQVRYDVARDKRLYADAKLTLENLLLEMDRVVSDMQKPDLPFADVKRIVEQVKTFQEELLKTVQSLLIVQVGIRVELVSLQPFEMGLEDTVNIGLTNRLDLMNAKAAVMDARRQMEVAANALRSTLDVEVAGDMRTPVGTDLLGFRGDISDLRVGLAFDAPLDLIRERNLYRASLIEYQRARREYMLFEDQVKLQIRVSWRNLEVLKQNLETQRQAVRIAAAQFDNAVEQANAPPVPGQQRGGTAGLQGQNLQRALQNVLSAQNGLISIWVDYETSRLNIYRDMGIMEIGPDGVWADPFYRDQVYGENPTFPGSFRYNGPDQPHDRLWFDNNCPPDYSEVAPLRFLDGQAGHADFPDRPAGGDRDGSAGLAPEPHFP